MCGSRVISTGLRVKRLCPGVDTIPTNTRVSQVRGTSTESYGLLHDVNPLAIAYVGGVVPVMASRLYRGAA